MNTALTSTLTSLLTLSPLKQHTADYLAMIADKDTPNDLVVTAIALDIKNKMSKPYFLNSHGKVRIACCPSCGVFEPLGENTRPEFSLSAMDMLTVAKIGRTIMTAQAQEVGAVYAILGELLDVHIEPQTPPTEVLNYIMTNIEVVKTSLSKVYTAVAGDKGNLIHTCYNCETIYNLSNEAQT